MSVVPDSIEPIEEWRTWLWKNGKLVSHNGVPWEPNEALRAVCRVEGRKEWALVRGGLGVKDAKDVAARHNQLTAMWSMNVAYSRGVAAPTVEPPPGYGYELCEVKHDAPHAGCSCGIYAGRTPNDCPVGAVLGKVKLWGTIVPGTKGARAEYAYPSELHVPESMADDPALLAYGVPVVVVNKTLDALVTGGGMVSISPLSRGTSRPRWGYRAAIAANLAACGLNLSLVAMRTVL